MNTLWQDLRYGARMLMKKPGFTLIAAITLALGIGANTAIFSIVDAVLLRPLPYKKSQQLVKLLESDLQKSQSKMMLSLGDFIDWKNRSQSFEAMAALSNIQLRMTGNEMPEEVSGNRVSVNFFDMLGVNAALGRTFLPEDENPESLPVALLTHGYWTERFAADADISGKTLTLNGKVHTIVGILPADFKEVFQSFPGRARIWVPSVANPKEMSRHGPSGNMVIARLKADVPLEQAQAEMHSIAEQLAQAYPKTNTGIGAVVSPLHEAVTGSDRPSLLILAGTVGFVLLIACANVASLMLARGLDRAKEIAIRLAIGAGRGKIIQQLLTESVLLSVVGGALGWLLAIWAIDAIVPMIPPDIPRPNEVTLNTRVLLFTLTISLTAGMVSGLVPAFQASKVNLTDALKDSGHQSSASRRSRYWRNSLVVLQIAFTFVLLIGAGLMTSSFVRLYRVDAGFNIQNLLTMNVSLPRGAKDNPAQWSAYWTEITERARGVSGVQDAAVVMPLPLSYSPFVTSISLVGDALTTDAPLLVSYATISHNYFQVMGISLLKGRTFDDADQANATPVIMINESFARLYFPNQEPLGARLMVDKGLPQERSAMIVGIVADSKSRLDQGIKPHFYQPVLQYPPPSMCLVTRTTIEASSLKDSVRGIVFEMDKNQPVGSIKTMQEIWATYTVSPRFYLVLLGSFALVALLLAVSGIYGIFSHTVSQRTREIGIRIALGAQTKDLLQMVIAQGMKLAVLGISIGFISAFALTRWLKNLLYEVSTTDATTFIMVALILTGVALVACFVPARRAARVDPMIALRCE